MSASGSQECMVNNYLLSTYTKPSPSATDPTTQSPVESNEIELLHQQIQNLTFAHAKEKRQLLESLDKKAALADLMRAKLSRYEFAVKEAVLFLGKPMDNYDVWLTGKTDQPSASIEKLSPQIPKSRTQSAMPRPTTPNFDKTREMSTPTPAQMAMKQQAQALQLISETSVNPDETAYSRLQSEITVMECVRLAINYLKNAQVFVKGLTSGRVAREELREICQVPVHDSWAQTDFVEELDERSRRSSVIKAVTTESLLESRSARIQRTLAEAVIKEKKAMEPIHDEEEEGDLASADFNVAKASAKGKAEKCTICRTFMLQLDHQRDEYDAIIRERDCLEDFLHEERSARDRLQQSKDILDAELEELTSQLFEQANKMVIEESMLRDELEIKNKDLNEKLTDLSQKIQSREEELIVLRRYINTLEKTRSMSKSESPYSSNNNLNKGARMVNVDGILFQEFQDFLQKVNSTQFITAAILSQIPFVKRCITEDVEPCLFYTYAQLGSTLKPTPLSTTMKKRIFDGVINLHCEFTRDETTQKRVKLRCAICNIVRDCDFKCSLSTVGKQVWSECCKFCQVRIAVCQDLFKFIGYFKSTKQQHTLLGLYRQIAMFRGAIVLARQGSHSMFDLEIVHASFIGTEWEKNVAILN